MKMLILEYSNRALILPEGQTGIKRIFLDISNLEKTVTHFVNSLIVVGGVPLTLFFCPVTSAVSPYMGPASWVIKYILHSQRPGEVTFNMEKGYISCL